jgi:predicted ATP-grasp superfamily ATP-dependent carboligase
MQTILISGARAPIALEMARSFHRAGHRVIMTDCQRLTIARWSTGVAKYYVTPSPRFDNDAYVRQLQQIIDKEKVNHFIPTCEEAIFVAAHREVFNCKVWTCDHKLIITLHNKHLFTQCYQDILPTPNTILLNDFTDWDNSDQYVFKPIYSRFASSVIVRKKISRIFFNAQDKNQWIAQSYIEGKEICIYSVWSEGQMKAYVAYHPLYRAGKGAGVFFEPVQNEKVQSHVKKIGTEIQYNGQLCFDVIIDEEENPYFIECNPRGTSGAHLLNTQLAEVFLGSSCVINNQTREFSIKYALAILHPLSFFRSRVRKSKDTVFRWDDLKPFFFQIFSLLEITWLKFSSRSSWLEATTADIEWNGDGS